MNRLKQIAVSAAAVLALLFGLLCGNYAHVGDLDRHLVWAQQQQMPVPSERMAYLGMLFTAAGAGVIGFTCGRKRAAVG